MKVKTKTVRVTAESKLVMNAGLFLLKTEGSRDIMKIKLPTVNTKSCHMEVIDPD